MQVLPERFNFAQRLLEANLERPSKVAYVDDDGRLTYGELEERVRRFASGLRELGVRQDERVLLLMHDTSDWPVAFLGSLYAGVVPVPVDTMLGAQYYAYVLQHTRAQAVFVSAALLPALQAALGHCKNDVRSIVVSRGKGMTGGLDLDRLLARSAPRARPAQTGAHEPGFWLYSSDSTHRMKAAVHTHANLHLTAELYGKHVLRMSEQDVCFSAIKLFCAHGLGNALTLPLSVGATVVLMAERPTPAEVLKRWLEHRPTVFCGTPIDYAGIVASPDLPSRDKIALQLCSSTGHALPREVGERFTRHFGCEILDGVGSTEMLHVFISNRSGQVRYGTAGKPVGGYRLQLRDEQGRPIIASNEIGELYVDGPTTALMYWGDRETTRESFQGKWTRTGDKYWCDPDGCYVYAGRSDDVLKIAGHLVSPLEIEATVLQHPAVMEVAVVGIVDADGYTRAKACVVLRDPSQAGDRLADDLKRFTKRRLAPHKCPRVVEFLANLPKTAAGEIERVRLRDRESNSKKLRGRQPPHANARADRKVV
jgi:benzoate-CoA ligase